MPANPGASPRRRFKLLMARDLKTFGPPKLDRTKIPARRETLLRSKLPDPFRKEILTHPQ